MKDKILEIWPEIQWISDDNLKEKVTDCWAYVVERSPLTIADLDKMPFSLLIEDCKISFLNHKRTTVQLAKQIANTMIENFGDEIKMDMDTLIAGCILMDVGKLLEYDRVDGTLVTSEFGKVVRHPFSGVALADRFGLSPEIQHIIATHSKEGDLGKRTVESIIAHHADFVSFEPFKS
jgi:putative nucleotidyltransferase with HDIG domain|tara:strand:- start:13723 stop:14256 length:534 start_codon:yes stop_codon:yes gene_type:complete